MIINVRVKGWKPREEKWLRVSRHDAGQTLSAHSGQCGLEDAAESVRQGGGMLLHVPAQKEQAPEFDLVGLKLEELRMIRDALNAFGETVTHQQGLLIQSLTAVLKDESTYMLERN